MASGGVGDVTDIGPFVFDRIAEADVDHQTVIPTSSMMMAKANQAFQVVPSIIAALPREGIVRVVLDSGYTLADAGDGLSFGFARGAKGAVAKQARFAPAAKSIAAISAAAFQIVSIVVAQAHLAEIAKRLQSIEDGVAQIRGTQVSELRAALQGSIEDAASAIADDAPDLAELRRVERELRDLQRQMRDEVNASIEALRGLRNTATFGIGGHFAAIRTKADEADRWLLMLAMCQVARKKVLAAIGTLDPDLPDRLSSLSSGGDDLTALAGQIREGIMGHVREAEQDPVMNVHRKLKIGPKLRMGLQIAVPAIGLPGFIAEPLVAREAGKRVRLNQEMTAFSDRSGESLQRFMMQHREGRSVLARIEDGRIVQLIQDDR